MWVMLNPLLCVVFLLLFAFAFALPLTEKDFDLQVNSLGTGCLLLILWPQSLMISVQRDNQLIVIWLSFFPHLSYHMNVGTNLRRLTVDSRPLKAGI